MTADAPDKPSRRRRWILIGSLALNICLIAFLAVGIARHHWHDGWKTHGFRGVLAFMVDRGPEGRFLWRFSDEDAAILRRLKLEHGPVLKESWKARRAAREAVGDLVRNGVRDHDQLRAAMNGMRQERMADPLEALLLDLADTLSDDGYQNLAGHRRH